MLPALHKSSQEFANEIRLLAAAKRYELGIVFQEKAAEIAGLNRLHFLSSVRFEL